MWRTARRPRLGPRSAAAAGSPHRPGRAPPGRAAPVRTRDERARLRRARFSRAPLHPEPRAPLHPEPRAPLHPEPRARLHPARLGPALPRAARQPPQRAEEPTTPSAGRWPAFLHPPGLTQVPRPAGPPRRRFEHGPRLGAPAAEARRLRPAGRAQPGRSPHRSGPAGSGGGSGVRGSVGPGERPATWRTGRGERRDAWGQGCAAAAAGGGASPGRGAASRRAGTPHPPRTLETRRTAPPVFVRRATTPGVTRLGGFGC